MGGRRERAWGYVWFYGFVKYYFEKIWEIRQIKTQARFHVVFNNIFGTPLSRHFPLKGTMNSPK